MALLLIHSKDVVSEVKALGDKLADKINIHFAESIAAANEYCKEQTPSLILAETELQDGNAFEFCTTYRLLQDQKLTPIVLFSMNPTDEEQVRTFQVGGDEYVKRFDLEHIQAVVEHELESAKQFDQLVQEKAEASNLAMEIMKSSGELGNAINFIERCHRFQSNEEISSELLSFCQGFDLNVVVGIVEGGDWHFAASHGKDVTNLERKLIQTVHLKDRFVDFGVRTQMNWPNIALLIKNMPLRQPDLYGRIKDLMPTLLSSANVRIHALHEESRVREQTELMNRSIEALQPSIKEVINAMQRDSKEQRDALSDFLQSIIVALPGLGLEDDQEEFFISRVESLIRNADNMVSRSEEHQMTLETTNQVLLNLMHKQKEIQELMTRPIEIAEKATVSEDNDDLFELF